MVITLLGTGTSSGIPLIGCRCDVCRSLDYRDKRLRVSIYVETQGKCFVIDTGPDFRQQMLREDITQLDAVIFTHQHKDHTAGLDDVRAFNFLQNKDMPVYGRLQVLEQLKREFEYVFADYRYPGIPRLQLHEITNTPFDVLGVTFTPIDVLHHRLPVFGFRIGNFAYLTDVNHIPEAELAKLQNLDVLILGALQRETHISHFNLQQAIDVVSILKPKVTYFTHLSHKMGRHAEVEKELPAHIRLGFDGLKIKLED
ncbi:phosphoribosyl 1,2-cyclic phosphate phosphodiesterase [Runella defluvii]|uniref:Phosphoribosyl 1,2-cyclic phosphate phosphodiesterase n=1 Tax=Runella defluvii TaxID=370973 RepID=A0A7W6ERZ3_9BACT|nr:MBL fold metallo-hydrolase [Runella defluvii]MBB3839941.1 phosphoribosyl 1,2-cyclic phosphate phosphodiesterase [Runella defluvii]